MKGRVCIIRHDYYAGDPDVRRDAEALRDAGYQVDIICLKLENEEKFELVNGINVYRIPLKHRRAGILRYIVEYSFLFLLSFVKLNLLCLKKKYDVIEVDTMPDFLVFITLIPKLLGSKVVLYFFEDMPELMANKFCLGSHNLIVKFLALVEKLSASYADHVIVCHELSRQKLFDKRKVKTPITVILNVPDEGMFSFSVTNASRTYPNDGPFTIIHHGTITENYGIQIIIEAVSFLRNEI
ncbi:unnamed protein product, partial [marine sediment metagenome]